MAMPIRDVIPFDLSGRWPIRKANGIVRALEADLRTFGVRLRLLDVTNHNDPFPFVIIQPTCAAHGHLIPVDGVCDVCR